MLLVKVRNKRWGEIIRHKVFSCIKREGERCEKEMKTFGDEMKNLKLLIVVLGEGWHLYAISLPTRLAKMTLQSWEKSKSSCTCTSISNSAGTRDFVVNSKRKEDESSPINHCHCEPAPCHPH